MCVWCQHSSSAPTDPCPCDYLCSCHTHVNPDLWINRFLQREDVRAEQRVQAEHQQQQQRRQARLLLNKGNVLRAFPRWEGFQRDTGDNYHLWRDVALNTTNISLLSHRLTVSNKDAATRKDLQTLKEDTRRQSQANQDRTKMAQFQSILSLWAATILIILWFTMVLPQADGHELTAYDCDKPRITDRVKIPSTGDCHAIQDPASNLTQTWTLLQTVRHKEIK